MAEGGARVEAGGQVEGVRLRDCLHRFLSLFFLLLSLSLPLFVVVLPALSSVHILVPPHPVFLLLSLPISIFLY